MVYLTAAVVLVGLLCLLDLVLTVGVIRRLREHTGLLDRVSHAGPPPGLGVPAGETVAEFEAASTGGDALSRELLSGRTLVGFFSPGCQPCAEQLPKFVEHAGSMPGGPERVLAVVAGGATEASEYTDKLTSVARVVVEEPGGPVQGAFQVTGFPALFLVDTGGVVAANGLSMDTMAAADPAPAPAAA